MMLTLVCVTKHGAKNNGNGKAGELISGIADGQVVSLVVLI